MSSQDTASITTYMLLRTKSAMLNVVLILQWEISENYLYIKYPVWVKVPDLCMTMCLWHVCILRIYTAYSSEDRGWWVDLV